MESNKDFGKSMGRVLAEAASGENAPKVAAMNFAEGVFVEQPRAKRPQLLGLEPVREWMKTHGITESTLRDALKEVRATIREKARKAPVLGLPLRSRRARKLAKQESLSEPVAVRRSPTGLFDEGVVPNKPVRPA